MVVAEKPPLRAVILDNDETTGSYGLLFAIINVLRANNATITNDTMKRILERLAAWMKLFNVFRPGLLTLLYTLLMMRGSGYIDSIIMYTNQTEIPNSELLVDSPPKCIAYMMNFLVEEPVFDHIITRDCNYNQISSLYIPKSFDRILDLYPDRARDIRNIIFIDDLASPDTICADNIKEDSKNSDCWYAICPYYLKLKYKDIIQCIRYVFIDILDNLPDYVVKIWDTYMVNYMPRGSSSMNPAPFLHVCEVVKKKYGFFT